MKRFVTISALLTLSLAGLAETGTHSLMSLDLPISGYSVASGEENISSHRDELGLSQLNPALLRPSAEEKRMGAFTFVKQIASANTFAGSYMQGIDERQTWGAYFNALDYGRMEGMDEYGNEEGRFSAADMTLGGDYARLLAKDFTMGIGLKFLYSQIEDYKAFGFAFDWGANYYSEEKGLSVSVSARNIGVLLNKYTDSDDSRDRLPFNLAAGVSKTLAHAPMTFHVTYHDLNRWDLGYYKSGYTEKSVKDEDELKKAIEVKGGDMLFRHFVFGMDFHPMEAFAVTASYNFRRNREMMLTDARTGAGWCFGLTVDVRRVKVQAGYSISGRAANTFGITAACKISDGIKRVEAERMF